MQRINFYGQDRLYLLPVVVSLRNISANACLHNQAYGLWPQYNTLQVPFITGGEYGYGFIKINNTPW